MQGRHLQHEQDGFRALLKPWRRGEGSLIFYALIGTTRTFAMASIGELPSAVRFSDLWGIPHLRNRASSDGLLGRACLTADRVSLADQLVRKALVLSGKA